MVFVYGSEIKMTNNISKSSNNGRMILLLYKVAYIIMQIGIFAATWLETQSKYLWTGKTTIALVAVFLVFFIVFLMTYSAFDIHKTSAVDLFVKHILSLGLSDFIIFVIIVIALKRLPDISDLIFMAPVQVAVSALWCFVARKIHFRVTVPEDAIIVYSDERAFESLKPVYNDTKNYHVIKTINLAEYDNDFSRIKDMLLEAEVVFLCGILLQERNAVFKFLVDNNKKVVVRPSIGDVLISTAEREYLYNVPVLSFESVEKSTHTLVFKRIGDILVSLIMLIVASLPMLCVALAIKLEDKGPVFYKQKRLTKDAKVFEIIKFRSMRVDAEKDGVARLAADKDDRITRVGKFIRATRLDELPQLINILKGEMSLIGPRPERPEIAAQYQEYLPEFCLRLKVKAGLTGYAQVYGKYNTTPYDKLQMDLMYIADMSVFLDVKLILLTVQTMLQKDSTEGVEKGSTTAIKDKSTK